MRWGLGDVAFGRPIHWIVALHGDALVDAEFAGVRTDRTSRGHRFLAPAAIELGSADQYVEALRKAHVIVKPEERQGTMHRALEEAARELGGNLLEDPFLFDECAALVEEPFVVPGSFDPAFLDLPDQVIVSVMRDHQRYFAVRDDRSQLLPRYLNVVNTAVAPEIIARGNDRVLHARLADARFFVDEDRKVPLGDRVPRLDKVVFQTKLGTIGDKVRRVSSLLQGLVNDSERDHARQAALLCKADLVTLIVGEFPELEGEMGRFYAMEEGIAAEVADALRDHYRPRGAGDAVASHPLGASLGVADKLDTLVGCFGIGLTPTGSADPFALRRAALGIIRTALEGPIDVDLTRSMASAYQAFEEGTLRERSQVLSELESFFRGRLRAFYSERFDLDLVDACLGAWEAASIRDLHARIEAIAAFRRMPEYGSLAIAFKRAFNIAKDAPPGDVDPALLHDEAERALSDRFLSLKPSIDASVQGGAYDDALSVVARELKEPIDRFFDEVFVMVDDEAIRDNRLRLLGGIARTLTGIAHFHHLST
jgi:glycyl-tRNA synthetase beta chain